MLAEARDMAYGCDEPIVEAFRERIPKLLPTTSSSVAAVGADDLRLPQSARPERRQARPARETTMTC
jgi:hypothetical protein